MGKRKVLLYLSIPILFILTVIALTFRLLGDPGADSQDRRPKFLANRGNGHVKVPEKEQDSLDLKFESTYITDPLEKTYDADKLLMLGMVRTPTDDEKKEQGMAYIMITRQCNILQFLTAVKTIIFR